MKQPAALPPIRPERQRQLRVMKRRATGLLVAMTLVYLALALGTEGGAALEYAEAGAAAAMVGGLADWFAVTALFRHPLGLPIPHTAVIAERKDQFGETLGDFVQENFLSPGVLSERIRTARAVPRAVTWLADEAHARAVAGHAAAAVVALVDSLRDADVEELLEAEARRAVTAVPLHSWSARVVKLLAARGRHQDALDLAVRTMERLLAENRAMLQRRFAEQAPWWRPARVDAHVFDRLADLAADMLREVRIDPDHELRRQFDQWVAALALRLESSPEMASRLEQLKTDFLAHPELARWAAGWWQDLKAALRDQAVDEDSELRRRLASAIAGGARRVRDDPEVVARLEQTAESAAYSLAERFRDEAAQLVSGTIARWDPQETSSKLELLLGRDLQFIRINGTVVGGMAGLVIHAVADVLG